MSRTENGTEKNRKIPNIPEKYTTAPSEVAVKPNFVVPYPSNHEGKVLGFACTLPLCVKLSNLVVAQTV